MAKAKKQRRLDASSGGGDDGSGGGGGGGGGSSSSLFRKLDRWLDDFEAVSAAVASSVGGSLAERIEAGGGIAHIADFLPPWVAGAVLALLESIPDAEWSLTAAAGDDYASNDVTHSFLSIKAPAGPALLQKVFRVLTLLAADDGEEEDDDDEDEGGGGQLWTFSAGRYDRGGHIEPHDDRAYTRVRMEGSGEVVECSRRVAVIWYLTRGWTAADGGLFVDYEANRCGDSGGDPHYQQQQQQQQPLHAPVEHVPRFNRLVAFTIPRWHAVTPVLAEAKRRYSIFGWFLEPGRLYSLDRGGQPPPAAAPALAAAPAALAASAAAVGGGGKEAAGAAGVDAGAGDGEDGGGGGGGGKRKKKKENKRGTVQYRERLPPLAKLATATKQKNKKQKQRRKQERL